MNTAEQQIPRTPKHGGLASEHPKVYERPQLIEWGALNELTKGGRSGLDDFPMDGGTEAE